MEYSQQQSAYTPPPQPQTPSGDAAAFEHAEKARAALILGIVGVILCWYPVLSIVGILLGAFALKRRSEALQIVRATGVKESGMNTAGFICGLIAVIGGALMTAVYLIGLAFVGLAFRLFAEVGVPAMASFFS